MKFFIDTEFIETKDSIELVSIGIVSEDGRGIYKVSNEFDESKADDWVKENVLDKIRGIKGTSLKKIRNRVAKFILESGEPPEFYFYYGASDWVLFYRLWGRLLDLPKSFPYIYIDLKQMAMERGLDAEWIRNNVPEPELKHHAIIDARWNHALYMAIKANDTEKLLRQINEFESGRRDALKFALDHITEIMDKDSDGEIINYRLHSKLVDKIGRQYNKCLALTPKTND